MTKKFVQDNITIENARLIFRNFSGNQTAYNPQGRRNFCVILEDEKLADALAKDGWNVKELQPREEGDKPQPYMQVAVSYENIPPMIKVISSRGQTILDESTVNMLDWAEIKNVDLIIHPYNWEVNGKSGVKAYVKTMYVTIEEDELAAKYEQAPAQVSDDDIPF